MIKNKELIQKVAKIDKYVVAHHDFSVALNGIEDCILKSEFYREPVGCLLLAEGGMGKTTLCKTILSRREKFKYSTENFERTIVPAFYFEIPKPVSIGSVASEMLRELGADNHLVGTTAQRTARLCTLLEKSRTKLIFADEFHNLFNFGTRSSRMNTTVCDWIKTIINETKVMFCAVGRPDFAPIFSTDSALTRRFPMRYQLSLLKPGDNNSPGTLVPFLNEILNIAKDIFEIKSVVEFDTHHKVNQVYVATGGNPAFLLLLIKEAITQFLLSGSSELRLDHFSTAWETNITSSAKLIKGNPFELSAGALATSLTRAI